MFDPVCPTCQQWDPMRATSPSAVAIYPVSMMQDSDESDSEDIFYDSSCCPPSTKCCQSKLNPSRQDLFAYEDSHARENNWMSPTSSPALSTCSTPFESPLSSPVAEMKSLEADCQNTTRPTSMDMVDADSTEEQASITGSTSSTTPSSSRTPATAADLPIEIFYQIVDCFDFAIGATQEEMPVESVRALGNLALVSRYCAKVYRPHILYTVFLRNSNSVRRMLDVFDTPPNFPFSSPAEHIRRIRLVHDTGADAVWLSQASYFISSQPFLARRATVNIIFRPSQPTADDASPTLFGSSVFHYLPRAMPLLFRQFYRLELHSIRFQLREHFIKLVSELRNLQWLYVDNLTWEEESSLEMLRSWPVSLQDIALRDRDRYSRGGRGTLPMLLRAVVTFPAPRVKTWEQEGLPQMLRVTPQRPGPFYQAQPDQSKHLEDIMYMFYQPGVSSILELGNEIEWIIVRLQRCQSGADTGCIAVSGCQNFPGVPPHRKPSVTPTVSFFFNMRMNIYVASQPWLYATNMRVNFRPLKPTTKQLLMYEWDIFFMMLDTFEHMEQVEFYFGDEEHCSVLAEEHRRLVFDAGKPQMGPPRRYLYTVARKGTKYTWFQ